MADLADIEDSMAEREDDEIRARSFWSGTITFGLVSIPVELFPANRSQRVSLRMVSADGTPLTRRYFCPKDERELDWDEIVRGYEIEENRFVVVTDEELERLAPEKTRDIDLRRFVPAADLDPIHFERAYYLTPGGSSTKAYRLLAATMEKSGKAGIATFVMRGKEYLIAILAENGIMRAETLRFTDELRSSADVGLPEPMKPKAAAVKDIEKAIAAISDKDLDEDELSDRLSAQMMKLVAKKEKTGEGVVDAPEGEAGPSGGVIDLMEVLKRSLQGNAQAESSAVTKPSGAKRASRAKKTTAKKTTAKKTTAKKTTAKKTTDKKPAAKPVNKLSAKKSAGQKKSKNATPAKRGKTPWKSA